MANNYLDAVLLMEVLSQMVGGIDTAVLSSSTSERKHQVGKTTFQITLHMGIGQLIYAL